MGDRYEVEVPLHLQELVEPTPSGNAKLLAAWDGLTPESQIQLLLALKQRPPPAHLYFRVIDKALGSENAYIRYLAARECQFSRDDDVMRLQERIEGDPDPLVRYVLLETEMAIVDFDEPEVFFALPHEARLAKVRRLVHAGDKIAKLISYASENLLSKNTVSDKEIFEIIFEYTYKFKCKESEFEYGEIEHLWHLALNTPEIVSRFIIENLPECGYHRKFIPNNVLKGMSESQLSRLFYRPDIQLNEFRKQKFFEFVNLDVKDCKNYSIYQYVVMYGFDLTNEEFSKILSMSDAKKISILTLLYDNAHDLRPCLHEAVYDAVRNIYFVSSDEKSHDYRIFQPNSWKIERKLKDLNSENFNKDLLELRLYRLAEKDVPWRKNRNGYPPSDELAFLEDVVVEGDTWATFIAFSKNLSGKLLNPLNHL